MTNTNIEQIQNDILELTNKIEVVKQNLLVLEKQLTEKKYKLILTM
jgi:hypothetical protein